MARAWWAALPLVAWSCGGAADAPTGATGSRPAAEGGAPSSLHRFSVAPAPIFDPSVLHEVRIVMDPVDWDSLRENFRSNQYYAANLTIDGKLAEQVGIRSRGDGSRDQQKPGLKVDFNKYVRSQELYGYKTLVIDNVLQDSTMIRERLAYAVYEAMGIPAPQIAHARLTVNDEYQGLYALIEPISKPFLKNRLGEESGNLFDYEYSFAWDFSFLGEDPESYIPEPFDPETNEDKIDAAALIDFVRTANEAPAEGFAEAMAPYLDVDKFLTYVATENALAEQDGFVGNFGVNNFYLYQYGDTTKFVFIPWDKDTAFTAAQWPIQFNLESNVLTRKLTADPARMRVYTQAVARAAQTAMNARYLGPRLEAAYRQIREATLTDTKKPWTNEEFEQGVEGLRGIIGAREADILAQAR
jgi:spore coat protein H